MKKDKVDLETIRHSTSHVMAQAVKELFPEVKLAIGPSIESGFYYDFETPHTFTPEDLEEIEKRMKEIIEEDLPFSSEEVSREEAKKFFKKEGEKYKAELLDEIEDDKVTLYKHDDFVDLCKGPHVPSTGYIKTFKLLSVAGAYWRGDEKRPMLQRIYGTAFEDKKQLEDYLTRLKEAEKRDHRILGRELDLFSLQEIAGAGLVLYHPKGALVKNLLEEFIKEENKRRGYIMVTTPHIFRGELWKMSGHYDYYRENMYYFDIEGQEYAVKPMNCPGHMLIYKSKSRSYRDLPMRLFELGTVYRHERSGVIHGLLRVRGFTQDDAHIICTNEQLSSEIEGALSFALDMLKTFGFEDYEIYLSTRPEKFAGSIEIWEEATEALQLALEKAGLLFKIDPGGGVFYGPKIDIKLKDCLDRLWQATTIQVDFYIPERFDLTYQGKDNLPHQPVMIHRAILGSLERFLGCLIEQYAGAFPTWLAPVQVVIIPIADRHINYAKEILALLEEEDLRVEIDERTESVNYKIRQAQEQRIPYMLVVGDKEIESKTVSVRSRTGQDRRGVSLPEFIAEINKEITSKENPMAYLHK